MCELECLRCLKFFGYRYNEIFLGTGPKSKHEIPCIPYTHTLKLTSNGNFNNYLHESFMIWNVPHRATSCLKTAEHFGFWILDLQIRNAQQLFFAVTLLIAALENTRPCPQPPEAGEFIPLEN